jgi:hypothetical protein
LVIYLLVEFGLGTRKIVEVFDHVFGDFGRSAFSVTLNLIPGCFDGDENWVFASFPDVSFFVEEF